MPQKWTPRRLAALYDNGYLRSDVLAKRHIVPPHQQYRERPVENTLTAVEEVERGKTQAAPLSTRRSLPSTARSTGSRMGALATARPTGLISSRTYETKLLARRTAVLQQYRAGAKK